VTIPELIPLFAVLGCVAGLLAGTLGLGGGVVIVPALLGVFSLLGFDPAVRTQMAVATSLATISVTSLSAIHTHHRAGILRWPLAGRLAFGILVGAFAGAFVADWLPGATLAGLFGGFAMVIAARMALAGRRPPRHHQESLPGDAGLAGAGGLIGLASSLFGIGGGSLTVPFLSGRGVAMREAVAVSSALGFLIAVAGSLGFVVAGWNRTALPEATLGYIHLPALAGIVLTSVPLARVGARLAHRLPAARLKMVFAAVLFGIGLKLVRDTLG
jgi:hypothetical protein